LGDSTNRGISMTKVDFDREVVWPGRGLMTLRAAFKALHEIWSTSDPIVIWLYPGGKDHPDTIQQTLPLALMN
jgi:hypothetical protein